MPPEQQLVQVYEAALADMLRRVCFRAMLHAHVFISMAMHRSHSTARIACAATLKQPLLTL